MMRTFLVSAALLAGCGNDYVFPPEPADDYRPHTADEEVLLAAASLPNLATFHHDLAMRCPDFGPERAVGDGCSIERLGEDGAFHATGVDNVIAAWRFDPTRALTLSPGLDLALDDLDGERQVIAHGALDPRVADDGHRAVFVHLESRSAAPELGEPAYLTLYDARTGELRRITDDPRDTAPWVVPGSDDVLFTSARTGLASLWLAPGDGSAPRQLTNVGLTRIEAGFVPVPSRELVWLPGTRKAVYSAHYGTHELYLLDVDTGEARHLGRGRLPAIHPHGGIVAIDDDVPGLGRQVVRIGMEEL